MYIVCMHMEPSKGQMRGDLSGNISSLMRPRISPTLKMTFCNLLFWWKIFLIHVHVHDTVYKNSITVSYVTTAS